MLNSISLRNKRVVLKNPTISKVERVESGLYLPVKHSKDEIENRKNGISRSEVVATSDDCTFCSAGDEVYYKEALYEVFGENIKKDEYIVVREEDILVRVNKDKSLTPNSLA